MLRRLLRPLLLVVPLATGLGCAPSLDKEALQRFEQAQSAFDTAQSPADFLRVAGMYQELVDRGIRSGAVFYNQGNAFMRAGQRGRAIASYRQAQRYLPRDPQLDANLRYALPSSAPVSRRSWGEYVLFWQDWISFPGKFQLTLVIASSAFLAGLLAVVGRWSSLRPVAWSCLLATLAMMASAVYDWNRYERRQHGVVSVTETLARKGNAESYEAAFTAPLLEGTEFLVQERRGGWIRLQLPGGEEGWVRERDVAVY